MRWLSTRMLVNALDDGELETGEDPQPGAIDRCVTLEDISVQVASDIAPHDGTTPDCKALHRIDDEANEGHDESRSLVIEEHTQAVGVCAQTI